MISAKAVTKSAIATYNEIHIIVCEDRADVMDTNEDMLPRIDDEHHEATAGCCNLDVVGRKEVIQNRGRCQSHSPTPEQQDSNSNDSDEDIFASDSYLGCSSKFTDCKTPANTIDDICDGMEVASFMEVANSATSTTAGPIVVDNSSQTTACDFRLPPEGGTSLDVTLPFPLHPFHNDFDHEEYYNIKYLRQKSSHPIACLKNQTEISPQTRQVLLDWLLNVCYHYKLRFDTFHIAVNILDRYTKRQKCIEKTQYQLVGVTSLVISAKQVGEERPSVQTALNLCDDIYTKEQLITLERHILKSLNFELHVPTACDFLDFYLIYGNVTGISLTGHSSCLINALDTLVLQKVCFLARRLIDIGVADYNFAQCMPSIAADATLCVAVDLLEIESRISTTGPCCRQEELADGAQSCHNKQTCFNYWACSLLRVVKAEERSMSKIQTCIKLLTKTPILLRPIPATFKFQRETRT